MRNRWSRRLVLYLVLALCIGWPLSQVWGMLNKHNHEDHDAVHLLYQVSLFQLELLNNHLSEAGQIKDTAELKVCTQALYSFGYAHERLVLAEGGEDQLAPMSSIPQFLQYIQRLQIGGERELKAEEVQMLQEAGTRYHEMYEAYEKLMASNGDIVSSQNSKLSELDSEITEMLREKLLE